MNPERTGSFPVEGGQHSNSWSRRRWWGLVLLVFAAHIGFIFAVGDRQPVLPRMSLPVSVLNLGPDESELQTLNDPTLFALPNRHGIAGQAWLNPPRITFAPYRWTEAPRLLQPRPADFGVAFGRFMATNAFPSLVFETKSAPESFRAVTPDPDGRRATNSVVRLSDNLAGRRWLRPPALRSWAAADLLTNTVVQMVVRPEGDVLSVTLPVPPPPGNLDQQVAEYALQLARGARFEPVAASTGLMFGTLVFEWHTEPLPPGSQNPP